MWGSLAECVVCGALGAGFCRSCAARLQPALPVPPIAGVSTSRAMFAYAGIGQELIAALKYRNRRAAVAELGEALAVLVPRDATLVSWIPTSRVRRRGRGYDQAELLARRVARVACLACRPTLRRTSQRAQTGQNRTDRLRGPDFVPYRSVPGASIVVVDDVITTGSTVRSAAAALHLGGADDVHALALAFTSQAR